MKNEMTREHAGALLESAKQMLKCPMTNQPGMYVEFFNACEKLQKAVDAAERVWEQQTTTGDRS